MFKNIAANETIQNMHESNRASPITGTELEQMVGIHLLNDLNGQLSDISSQMERQLKEKQTLREEIDSILKLKQGREILEIKGQKYRDLSPQEAECLGVTQEAVPQTDETSQVTGYRIPEIVFQQATEVAVQKREDGLSSLNGEGELVMLKIQSLVDQRKNALTLLSNLLAASHEVAKTIISNVRS